jgi:hypothetical protein
MGNADGILSAFKNMGSNEVVSFDGGTFSFAYGDEIALVLESGYYILNCDQDLWDEVVAKVASTPSSRDLIDWWYEKSLSGEYEISSWSDDFSDLVNKEK